MLFVVKPGATNFNIGSAFTLLSTLFYARSIMVTRRLRDTDSSATMAFFSSLVYVVAAVILAPLAVLAGAMPQAHPSIAFLFRAWSVPALLDIVLMLGLGLVWAGGVYFVARAYSAAPTSLVSPFEYVTLPINVMWGFVIFRELPTLATLAGALLTLVSGHYVLIQDSRARQKAAGQPTQMAGEQLPSAPASDSSKR